jgi:oxygen-independent coproporphyrinogen-3 oxidase
VIFGVAGQRAEEARDEVRRIAELGPTHVSAYALTIEPGTRFGSLARAGKLPLLEDDIVARSFDAVHSALAELGFEHYEISNYARGGHYAEHNLAIWRGAPYLGLGAGAWGTVRTRAGLVRYRNAPATDRYASNAGSARLWDVSPLVSDSELIEPGTALSERILLGLRLAEGVDLRAAGRECGVEDAWTEERERAAMRLVRQGRLERDGDRVRIPQRAWLFADAVVRELL